MHGVTNSIASALSIQFRYLIAVTLASTGGTESIEPFSANRDNESAISFHSKLKCPGTHNNFKSFSCRGMSERNVLNASDLDEDVRYVHRDRESVVIIAVFVFKVSFRSGRTIAKS